MAWLDTYVGPRPNLSRTGLADNRGFIIRELNSSAGAVSKFPNGQVNLSSSNNLVGIPDAPVLRRWKRSNGLIKSAVQVRKWQIFTAPWDVVVVTPNLPERVQAQAERAAAKAKSLLLAPNPNGKNNSFEGLMGPLTDDLLVISQAALLKRVNIEGTVVGLEHKDGALVSTIKGWTSESDGPRYVLANPDRQTGKLLLNDELVLMVYEDNTYDEVGEPPLRTLQTKLQAMMETFESVAELQRNRAPSTLLNFSGMDDAGLERMKRLIRNELLGVSAIGVFNYPLEGVEKLDLTSVNLQEQGVAWFWDMIVREICSVFMITTSQIAWEQDTNRATAQVQLRVALDSGVIPLMKLIQGYVNREIVSSFHNPHIRFVWTELMSTDSPVDANVLAKQAGPVIYMSINELRISAGLFAIDVDRADQRWPWLNEPFVPAGQGALVPVSVACLTPEYNPDVQGAMGDAMVEGLRSQAQGQNSANNGNSGNADSKNEKRFTLTREEQHLRIELARSKGNPLAKALLEQRYTQMFDHIFGAKYQPGVLYTPEAA